jgi:hypothetical protein
MSNTVSVEAKQNFVYIKSHAILTIMCIPISNEHHSDNNHFLQPSSLSQQLYPSHFQTLNTMAGAAFVEALGLIGTGLGIIQFGLDNLASDPKGTIVGIKAGAGKGASNTLVSADSSCGYLSILTRSITGWQDLPGVRL